MSDLRVVVVDDQELVRAGFALVLERGGMSVVGQAADGAEALELVTSLPEPPDVVLMDVRMPVLDGIEATRRLVASGFGGKVLALTTFDLDEYVYAALRAGARGFLLKDAGADVLGQAVRAAAAGDALIAPSVTARLISAFADAGPSSPAEPLEAFTEREEEVLVAVATGRTNAEIAQDLHVSVSTVKTHVASLLTKLGARNRVEVALWAYQTRRVRP